MRILAGCLTRPKFKSLESYFRATWSFISSEISTNVAHLSAVNFYSHNDMDMMEIGEILLSKVYSESSLSANYDQEMVP